MRINYILLIILTQVFVVVFPTQAFTQSDSSSTDGKISWFSLNYDLDFDATGLNNRLAMNMWTGNYIPPSQLESAFSNLSEKQGGNIAGLFNHMNFSYATASKRDSIRKKGYIIGFGHLQVLEAVYDKDLFGLMFFGNKRFAGSELIFEDQLFRNTSIQYLYGGRYWNKELKNGSLSGSVGLSFLKGQNNMEININEISLNTSSTGDQIDIGMDYAFTRSDTQYTRYFDMNGYGAGLNMWMAYTHSSGLMLSASLKNLGAVRWVNNNYQFEKDSSFTYVGWEIPNIFNAPGSIFEAATPDSALSLITSENSGNSLWRPSPAIFDLQMMKTINKTLSIYGGVSHVFFTKRKPMVFIGPQFSMAKGHFTVFPFYQYGGYGGSHAGLELKYMAAKKLFINLRAGAIDSYILPKQRAGASINLSVHLIR